MKGQLLKAIQSELQALYAGTKATVLDHTMFKAKDMPSYSMPLIMFRVIPGEDSGQYMGGVMRREYVVFFSIYNWMPDAYGMDTTGFSENLQNEIGKVEQHFCNFETLPVEGYEVFLSPLMTALYNNYGTRWTFEGPHEPDNLEGEGAIVMGEGLRFITVSHQLKTSGTKPSPKPLDAITQLYPPPLNGSA